MKHHLEWKNSTLNIRCWRCSEILVSISTEGFSINFNSTAESIEIDCPNCHSTCEYSLFEDDASLFQSHDWDSDIDLKDFNGKSGEINRSLFRQYKSLLGKSESTRKFMENEFDIVGNYLESLGEAGIDGSAKDEDIIDNYIAEHKRYNRLSKNREKLIRRAINRFYRLLEKGDLPPQEI